MSQKTSDFINNLFKSFFTTFNIFINSKTSNIKSTKYGEVIVLANGPSIKEEFKKKDILTNMSNTDSICVNHFFKSELFDIIQPNNYIISAPELWEEDINETHTKSRLELFNKLKKDVNWEMNFYIPFQAKKSTFWLDILKQNNNITIEYYNITPIEGFQKYRFRWYNKQKGTPRCHNVVGYALMILIWKGYTEIGLFGVDHSWTKSLTVTEKNEALLSQPHFYNTDAKHQKMDTKGKPGEDKRKLHEIIHKFYLAFKAYFEINEYAKTKGVKIYNLTKGSFIDAYPRMDSQDFFLNSKIS